MRKTFLANNHVNRRYLSSSPQRSTSEQVNCQHRYNSGKRGNLHLVDSIKALSIGVIASDTRNSPELKRKTWVDCYRTD